MHSINCKGEFDRPQFGKRGSFQILAYKGVSLGPFTKDVRLTPWEGGSANLDVQLLFECDFIVLSRRRRGGGSGNLGFSRTSFVNGSLSNFLPRYEEISLNYDFHLNYCIFIKS